MPERSRRTTPRCSASSNPKEQWMGLFGRDDDDDRDQQQQQQQQAPQGLSQGIPMQREVYQQQAYQPGSTSGLPPHALERLREMRPDQPGALFTSDLSVDELLLVREAG